MAAHRNCALCPVGGRRRLLGVEAGDGPYLEGLFCLLRRHSNDARELLGIPQSAAGGRGHIQVEGGRSHRTRAHSHRMATRLWAHWPCALDQAGLQSDLDPHLLALFFPRGLKFRVTHLRQIFPRPRLGLNDPA